MACLARNRGGAGVITVPPGVNAFWSAGVQREAALEQIADVARPEIFATYGGGASDVWPCWPWECWAGSTWSEPWGRMFVVALALSRPWLQEARHGGPVQARGAGALHGGPGQALGAGALHGGPGQAQGTMNGAGPGQALAIGTLSQPSPEKSGRGVETAHHEGGRRELR